MHFSSNAPGYKGWLSEMFRSGPNTVESSIVELSEEPSDAAYSERSGRTSTGWTLLVEQVRGRPRALASISPTDVQPRRVMYLRPGVLCLRIWSALRP